MESKTRVARVADPIRARRTELRRSLEERRHELGTTLHDRMREVRMEHLSNVVRGGLPDGETSDVNIQEDIELALIQMRAETLRRVDEAIARLDAGVYGRCSSCGHEIATSRLRALPFAVRCLVCEEQDESERPPARTDEHGSHAFSIDPADVRERRTR